MTPFYHREYSLWWNIGRWWNHFTHWLTERERRSTAWFRVTRWLCRKLFGYRVLVIRELGRRWADADDVMENAIFQTVVNFVEWEDPFDSLKKTPEEFAGDRSFYETEEIYQDTLAQIELQFEELRRIREIYTWYTDRRLRQEQRISDLTSKIYGDRKGEDLLKNPSEFFDWMDTSPDPDAVLRRSLNDELEAAEAEYEADKERMLQEALRLRGRMWT